VRSAHELRLPRPEGSEVGLEGAVEVLEGALEVLWWEEKSGAPRGRRALGLCAEHVRPLGGESPLTNLVEVKVKRSARATS